MRVCVCVERGIPAPAHLLHDHLVDIHVRVPHHHLPPPIVIKIGTGGTDGSIPSVHLPRLRLPPRPPPPPATPTRALPQGASPPQGSSLALSWTQSAFDLSKMSGLVSLSPSPSPSLSLSLSGCACGEVVRASASASSRASAHFGSPPSLPPRCPRTRPLVPSSR